MDLRGGDEHSHGRPLSCLVAPNRPAAGRLAPGQDERPVGVADVPHRPLLVVSGGRLDERVAGRYRSVLRLAALGAPAPAGTPNCSAASSAARSTPLWPPETSLAITVVPSRKGAAGGGRTDRLGAGGSFPGGVGAVRGRWVAKRRAAA